MPVHGVGPTLLVTLLLALAVAGCETRAVDPQSATSNSHRYTTVVVGDIEPLHPEWKRLVRLYKEGLARRLRESKAFDRVLHPAPVVVPPDAVVVEGTIDGVDEGSEFLRMLIARNASRATVEGQFRFVDGSEGTLAEFRQERVSNSGSFRDDQIYMEDLVGALGQDTATILIRWSRGKGLEPDPAVAVWWSETLGIAD